MKELLQNIPQEVISEDTLNAIETAFNDRVKLHVEKALSQQDELYAEKLQTLIDAIDADHTAKLNKVVEAIDTNNTAKLKAVIAKYENELNSGANSFKEGVVEAVSDYLDLYIEEKLPINDIKQAVQNKQAYTVLESLRKTLAIDSALMNDSIREAVIEGKNQIDESKSTIETLNNENTALKVELDKVKSEFLLEQKTVGMPGKKKEYLKRILADKPSKFIQENFDYTSKLFDKKEQERLSVLKEEAFETRVVKGDAPVVVAEKSDKKDPLVSSYINELQRVK